MTKTPRRTTGPTLRRWQIGKELTTLREAAGQTAAAAAELLGCTKGRISQIEHGRNPVGKQDLRALLEFYGAMDRLPVLEEIREESHKRGWWSIYRLPPWLGTYIGLESDAVRTRRYAEVVVPGMLQTEEYARTVNAMPWSSLAEPQNERNITARLQRGSKLLSDDFTLQVVLDEALLMKTFFMPSGIGVRQLRRILHSIELPTVTIQVLPFDVGANPGMAESFTLLDFPEGTLETVAFQSFNEEIATVDKHMVRCFELRYEELARLSLSPELSASLIEKFIK